MDNARTTHLHSRMPVSHQHPHTTCPASVYELTCVRCGSGLKTSVVDVLTINKWSGGTLTLWSLLCSHDGPNHGVLPLSPDRRLPHHHTRPARTESDSLPDPVEHVVSASLCSTVTQWACGNASPWGAGLENSMLNLLIIF